MRTKTRATVNEVMSHPVISASPDETIHEVLKKMEEKDVNGMPVVGGNGRLEGMVVKADIYRFMIDPGHMEVCPVSWVMSKEVVTAGLNEDILDAAIRLRERNIVAMPVIDGDEVAGVITLEDIVDFLIETEN